MKNYHKEKIMKNLKFLNNFFKKKIFAKMLRSNKYLEKLFEKFFLMKMTGILLKNKKNI